ELLANDRGVLVPFRDPGAIADAVISLLADESRLHAMRKRAYMLGREMVWSNVAHRYVQSFIEARKSRPVSTPVLQTVRTLHEQGLALPKLKLTHLARLSDNTGLLQHARYTLPRLEEGYCTDDNARGLILCVLLEDLDEGSEELERLGSRYAAFVDYAYHRELGKFRNFMGFDRRWLEEVGADDAHARAVWALGVCVGRSKHPGLQHWAAELFPSTLSLVPSSEHLRPWAFALLGIQEYLRRLPGDRTVCGIRDELVARLLGAYEKHSTPKWRWF